MEAETVSPTPVYSCLKDAISAGVRLAPSGEYLRYSKLRGSVICIEGPIGVGKTTLGLSITDYLSGLGLAAEFLQESVDEPLLEKFYSDPAKYAFTFQYFKLKACIANLEAARRRAKETGAICFVDRSTWGNAVFAVLQKAKGNISAGEWGIYLALLRSSPQASEDFAVYLDCEPTTSYERLRLRDRDAEANVGLPYLEQLERHYTTAMLLRLQQATSNIIPVPWNKFGGIRSVLDAVLSERTFAVRGDVLTAFTGDRAFRARCVAALVKNGSVDFGDMGDI